MMIYLGLNCKIDSVFADIEFDELSQLYYGDYKLDSYAKCNHQCSLVCPVSACGEYQITYIGSCNSVLAPYEHDTVNMCRACISQCKLSESLR